MKNNEKKANLITFVKAFLVIILLFIVVVF